jgi:hypothetical protein
MNGIEVAFFVGRLNVYVIKRESSFVFSLIINSLLNMVSHAYSVHGLREYCFLKCLANESFRFGILRF